MTLSISLKSNFEEFRDKVAGSFKNRDQIPFATAAALTAIAKKAKIEMAAEIPNIFKKKGQATPFTRNAMTFVPARKYNLVSEVNVKPIQAAYLALEETGGIRTPGKGSVLSLPTTLSPLNQYGGIRKGSIRSMQNRAGYFMGVVRGVHGLWQRLGPGRLALVVAFRKQGTIKPKWHYFERLQAMVKRDAGPLFEWWLRRAIETKR